MWFILGVIAFIAIIIASANAKSKRTAKLKDEYDAALRGRDKQRALNAGREYYAALRSGKKLTMYDEQAITNDLSAMNVKPEQ